MGSGIRHGAPASAEQAQQVGDILEPRERLEFEHLLQWLRLSFLLTPLLVVLAFGMPAGPYALFIAAAVAISFGWVEILARFRPASLLRLQLWLRVVDCGLIYVVLVNYHAFLHDAYYDAVVLLFVVAAAASPPHGRAVVDGYRPHRARCHAHGPLDRRAARNRDHQQGRRSAPAAAAHRPGQARAGRRRRAPTDGASAPAGLRVRSE